MARLPMNPWLTNSFLDTCAFDPKYEPETTAANEILRLLNEEELPLVLAHSVAKELEHPNTPAAVKRQALTQIYSLPVGLNPQEIALKARIHALITGNGRPEKYKQDANHIFEAQKYGSYFATTDNRLLKKGQEIAQFCSVTILLPSEFLALVNANKSQNLDT